MKKYIKYIYPLIAVIFSAFIQAYSIEVFIKPSNLLTGGFTGLAILINMLSNKVGINLSIGFLLVALNLPVALLCAREISKKFVIFSLLQIFITSFFLSKFHFQPIFTNTFLNITIGAVIYAVQMVTALRVGASTGGTDFIALYISNRINKSIWLYVFIFNMFVVLIFGYIFGWDSAGYSIVFQFISTKVVDTFYNRYHRMTIQIITRKPDEVCEAYIKNYRHGMTRIEARGAYTNKEITLCLAVVSVYEVSDVVKTVLNVDNNAIINTFKTESFYGNFYFKPI